MSEDGRALEAVKFPRYERRGFFLGLKWYQLLIVAGGVAVAIVASASHGPVGLFTTGPMWLALILLGILQYSRVPYPVWAQKIATFFYRAAVGQTRFLAKPEAPRLAGRLALPGGLGNLETRTTARGECFLVDGHGKEVIAVLRCSTRSFALLDADDKAWAVQAWSRVQAGMAQRQSVARIAIQDYTVPYPSSSLWDFYRENALPARDKDDSGWGQRAYEDLLGAAGSAMSHELVVAVVLDTSKARRRIRESGGGVTGLEHVLRLEVDAIRTSLGTHNVKVEEWFGEAGLLAIIRGAFDPALLPAGKAMAVTASASSAPAAQFKDELMRQGPMGVEEHWTYLRTDSGFHQTFWIAEWPRQKVFPGSSTL